MVIALNQNAEQDDPAKCEVCSRPVLVGSVCSACGLGLFDFALSSVSDENVQLPGRRFPEDLDDLSAVGSIYGHFEVCRLSDGTAWELGRGAMGITYKATDINLGRAVALKLINPRLVAGASGRDRFLREARATARLHHPHVASIFHLGTQEGECFYAMEYIAGETLEARVRRAGPLPPETALEIVLQIAEALCHAHGQQFTHRDIKPSNIMFTGADTVTEERQPTVKLIDFGLVKAWTGAEAGEAQFHRNYFAGTPRYASPEQLSTGHADARSDIFSLGRCWWYMLTGRHLSAMEEKVGTSDRPASRTQESVRAILGLTTPARLLLDSMVAPDPECRPPDAAALVASLQRCRAAHLPSLTRQGFAVAGLAVLGLVVFRLYLSTMSRETPSISKVSATETANRVASAHVLYGEAEELRIKFTKIDNEQAARLYTRAIEYAPAFADAYAGLAVARYQAVARFGEPSEKLDAAAEAALRAIDLDPKSPKGYHALAAVRTVQGRPWQALKHLHRTLELDPKYLPAMRDFSLAWSWVGQPQKGLAWAKAAAEIDPASLQSWIAAAEASAELADDTPAQTYYRRCVQLNPGWTEAYCGLIRLHLLEQDFEQARHACILATSASADSIYLQTIKAQVSFLSGDDAEAEGAYRKLLQANRRGLVNYYGGISYLSALALLCQRHGDVAESAALLEEAAKSHDGGSEGPQAIYDLAAIRSIAGRKEEALVLLGQAIDSGWMDYRATRLDPRFEKIRSAPEFQRMIDGLCTHVAQMRQTAQRLCAHPLNLADYTVQTTPN